MFQTQDHPQQQRNYQNEWRKIEPQNHYIHNFKIIDYQCILGLMQDQRFRQSNKEEQKKEEQL